MINRAKIQVAHQASYSNPIKVAKNEVLQLDGREDNWDGHRWLWAAAPDGRKGWVPENLIDEKASIPVALYNYSAKELTCDVSDCVVILYETLGWAWCRDENQAEGWLPLKCFQ